MPLTTFALNCSLKSSAQDPRSSTDVMLDHLFDALKQRGVEGGCLRTVDHDIRPGVTSDEGAGDAWPDIRRRILEADVFVLATPIWLGHPSSVCQRVLERMDAFIGEQDDGSRMPPKGKPAIVAVVGNEDGAHHVSAELYQGLSDVGFTIPPNGVAYWVGEAMHGTDFRDLDAIPKPVQRSVDMATTNAVHLARLLRDHPYPAVD